MKMMSDTAEKIIRKNNNYIQAYHEMLDNGFSEIEAETYWEKYQNVCGEDWKDPMEWISE